MLLRSGGVSYKQGVSWPEVGFIKPGRGASGRAPSRGEDAAHQVCVGRRKVPRVVAPLEAEGGEALGSVQVCDRGGGRDAQQGPSKCAIQKKSAKKCKKWSM